MRRGHWRQPARGRPASRQRLDEIVRDRAAAKAHNQFGPVAQGMMLENQSLTTGQMHEELERLTAEILNEPLRYLWEDE